MSQFLPESSAKAPPSITPAHPAASGDDVALMQRVFNAAAASPGQIPEAFMAYMLDWLQVSNLNIPIGQVFGFTQFTAQFAQVVASESTTSSTYTNLGTVGPTLDGIPDGRYVFLFSCGFFNAADGYAYMGVKYNTTEADDDSAAQVEGLTNVGMELIGFSTAVLANGGSNTVTARYRSTVASGTGSNFYRRRLVALRYANL